MGVSMADKHFIVVLGPAGSGKTTLCNALGKWISKVQGFKVAYINLDPGAEYLPYKPGFDVRSIVKLEEIMRKYGLGPNGALMKSMNILESKVSELSRIISLWEADFVIVDTPGQMELFLFRDIGPLLVEELKRAGFVMGILIYDLTLISRPSDLISLKLLTLITQLRLGIESIPVVNKWDEGPSREKIRMIEDFYFLKEITSKEKGLSSEISEKILDIINKYGLASRIVKVSALKGAGLEELYDIIHEVYCTCGDLT